MIISRLFVKLFLKKNQCKLIKIIIIKKKPENYSENCLLIYSLFPEYFKNDYSYDYTYKFNADLIFFYRLGWKLTFLEFFPFDIKKLLFLYFTNNHFFCDNSLIILTTIRKHSFSISLWKYMESNIPIS